MDYRTAYEHLSKAIWKYDKVHSDAWVTLMKEIQRIESTLDKGFPPIILHRRHKEEDCLSETGGEV
ncbi:hypothetical protein LJC32_02185 [Oscillospiraceae bacterium OttesenSCG-928-F05]|nr:hypothetical protein [Oscillospiraceae bacterium OttesenSCG-928-F05]